MLKTKIREGTLEINDTKMIVRRSIIKNPITYTTSAIVNLFGKQEDVIFLKDISLVVFETGIPEKMCPHILVYYGNKTRIIEFCEEKEGKANVKKKSELQKVLEFLEKKNIELGVAFEA